MCRRFLAWQLVCDTHKKSEGPWTTWTCNLQQLKRWKWKITTDVKTCTIYCCIFSWSKPKFLWWKNLFYIALIIWINLPNSLKTKDNLNTYKHRVKEHFFFFLQNKKWGKQYIELLSFYFLMHNHISFLLLLSFLLLSHHYHNFYRYI